VISNYPIKQKTIASLYFFSLGTEFALLTVGDLNLLMELINMDSIFGISEQALSLCEERSSLISSNLANASTPNYKAKDINFQSVLGQMNQENNSGSLLTNEPGHIVDNSSINPATMYRIPMQDSLDGNTVDQEIERKNFMQNAVRFEVNLTFVHNRTKELLEAIKGE